MVCDLGLDEASDTRDTTTTVFRSRAGRPEQGPVLSSMAQVCESSYTVGDLISGVHNVTLSQLCRRFALPDGTEVNQNILDVGNFKVVYSFVNDEGMRGEVTRTITVLKDCSYPQPTNPTMMESACIVSYKTCSVNGVCLMDNVDEVLPPPPPDMPPQIELRVPSIGINAPDLCSGRRISCTDFAGNCACVLNRTVSIRQGQPYIACGIDPTTGERIQPVATPKGDKMCEPGVDAYDLVTTRIDNLETTTTLRLTDDVMACPPAECATLGVGHDICAPHKFSIKGIQGCIPETYSVEVNTIVRVMFMVQDQTFKTTIAYRNVQIIDPCPIDEAGAPQFLCPDTNCYSSEAACAFTMRIADSEGQDHIQPEVVLVGPDHVVHEYQVPYKDRYGACASAAKGRLVAKAYDDATAVEPVPFFSWTFSASHVANNPNAPVISCGAYAVDRGIVDPVTGITAADEDLTRYVAAAQVVSETGDELQFLVTQQGAGGKSGPLPGRYTYTYSVVDEMDIAGNTSRTIDVVTRVSTSVTDIRVPASLWGDGQTSSFAVSFKEALVVRTIQQLGDGEYFYGNEHVVLVGSVTAPGEVTFALAVDILQLPQSTAVIIAKGKGSKAYWKALGYDVSSVVATRRRRLTSDIGGSSTSTPSSAAAAEPSAAATSTTTFELKTLGRRHLTGLADLLSSGLSNDLNSAGNRTDLAQNLIAISAPASPAIDYDLAKLASLQAEISTLSTTLIAGAAQLTAVEDVLGGAADKAASWRAALGKYWKNRLSVADASIKALQIDAEETLRVLDATISVQRTVAGSVVQLELLLKQQRDVLNGQLEMELGGVPGEGCIHRGRDGAASFYFNATKLSILGSPPPSPAPPSSPQPLFTPPHPPPTPPSLPIVLPTKCTENNTMWNATALACQNVTTRRRLLLDNRATDTVGRKLLARGASREHATNAYTGAISATNNRFMRLASRLINGGGGSKWSRDSNTSGIGVENLSVSRRRRLLQSISHGDERTSVTRLVDWGGYDLRTGGAAASQNFEPPATFIGRRFVSNTNRVIGGVLIHQTRNDPGSCFSRFSHLNAPCRGTSTSQASFGVDPLFNPPVGGGKENTMFNGDLVDVITDFYNTSQGSGHVKGSGVPYAFTRRKLAGMPDGFLAYLDIAATRDHAARFFQFLKEGIFFDRNTRHVMAQAVTYNANLKQLANVRVNFEFNSAGFIALSSDITTINVKWYTERSDDNKDGISDGTFLMAIEATLYVMVLANIFHELFEVARLCKAKKSISTGLRVHFLSIWKVVDVISMGLQLTSMMVWISYQVKRRTDLFPKLRFDVYDNAASPDANYFLPRKKVSGAPPPPPPPSIFFANQTRMSADSFEKLYVDPFKPTVSRWELENDDDGIDELGQMITTINELSGFLNLYFCTQGLVMLLMIVQILKLTAFQKHLDITVKTLYLAGPELMNLLVVFGYTLLCSAMVAHIMLGSLEESFATLTSAFNFHFEIILHESIGVFSALLTDKSIVRTDVEYATLVIYSFFAPILIIWILLQLFFGITLCPMPHTPYPIPFTLYPVPYTLHSISYTLHPISHIP